MSWEGLVRFWNSPVGSRLLEQRTNLHRELPFTARFNAEELSSFGVPIPRLAATEFLVVQGVADLVALLPGELWLLDFKTDQVNGHEVAAREMAYAPQVRLYAAALARIYDRPVTQCWLHFIAANVTREVSVAAR